MSRLLTALRNPRYQVMGGALLGGVAVWKGYCGYYVRGTINENCPEYVMGVTCVPPAHCMITQKVDPRPGVAGDHGGLAHLPPDINPDDPKADSTMTIGYFRAPPTWDHASFPIGDVQFRVIPFTRDQNEQARLMLGWGSPDPEVLKKTALVLLAVPEDIYERDIERHRERIMKRKQRLNSNEMETEEGRLQREEEEREQAKRAAAEKHAATRMYRISAETLHGSGAMGEDGSLMLKDVYEIINRQLGAGKDELIVHMAILHKGHQEAARYEVYHDWIAEKEHDDDDDSNDDQGELGSAHTPSDSTDKDVQGLQEKQRTRKKKAKSATLAEELGASSVDYPPVGDLYYIRSLPIHRQLDALEARYLALVSSLESLQQDYLKRKTNLRLYQQYQKEQQALGQQTEQHEKIQQRGITIAFNESSVLQTLEQHIAKAQEELAEVAVQELRIKRLMRVQEWMRIRAPSTGLSPKQQLECLREIQEQLWRRFQSVSSGKLSSKPSKKRQSTDPKDTNPEVELEHSILAGDVWVRCFDVMTGDFYFYNHLTGSKTYSERPPNDESWIPEERDPAHPSYRRRHGDFSLLDLEMKYVELPLLSAMLPHMSEMELLLALEEVEYQKNVLKTQQQNQK